MSRKPSIAHHTQHYSLQDFNMLPMEADGTFKDVFHSASYTVMTVDHSLSGVTASNLECTCISRDVQIVQMCYAISGLAVQSRD